MNQENLEDEFIDFWDSKKESLGLGNYSSDVTEWWLQKINTSPKEEKCNQCKLENNKGICDRKDCSNSSPKEEEINESNWEEHYPIPSPKVSSSWEEEFEEMEKNHGWIPEHKERIKSFLSSTINEVIKEERERIIKEIKAKGLHLGYANPIIDIINFIKSKYE